MILALPNTGTDWLASNICECDSKIRYSREFFNPICNKKYEMILKPWFGCEMASSIAGIAKKISKNEYNDIINKTWKYENFNYTKENYSSFKVENHVNKFNCCVFYRRLSQTLPGSRHWNVIENWYCSMFQSLILNQETIDESLKPLVEFAINNAATFDEQCAMAYLTYYAKLFLDAKKYGLPIVHYEKLITGEEADVINEVKKIPGVRSDLAENIIQTRSIKEKITISCSERIENAIALMPIQIKNLFIPW